MALTAAQVLQVKKHIGVVPTSTTLDASIDALEDGSVKEAELVAALNRCNSTMADYQDAQENADDLTEGGGAKFSHPLNISIKRKAYDEAVMDLARLLGIDIDNGVSGLVGWRVY